MGPRTVWLIMTYSDEPGPGVAEGTVRFSQQGAHWEIVLHDLAWGGSNPGHDAGEVDGIILAAGRNEGERLRATRPGCPIVQVMAPPGGPFPVVRPDNIACGHLAGEHLRGLGLIHFAYVGFVGQWWSEHRRVGLESVADVAGGLCMVYERPMGAAWDDDELAEWLRELPQPVGVVTANCHIARRVSGACRRGGLAVPDDLAILAIGESPLGARMTCPAISAVDHGAEQIGYQAAVLLDRMMRGQSVPADTVLPPARVVPRGSTEVLAVDDEDLRGALRFIRAHACEGANVNDLLARVPASRRKLERAFKARLGRTILGEIRRVRLDRARYLLLESDLPMPDVAARCGLASASDLSNIFKRETGLTPTAFRRRYRM